MKGAQFERLGRRVREDLRPYQDVDKASDTRARRQLLARVEGRTKPRHFSYAGLAWGMVAVVVAVAIVAWATAPTRQQPIRFWVEARAGQVDEWVTARDAEQSMRFSDGSSVVAAPHTTTRVMQVTPDGARLTLERGRLEAHVVHREASSWKVAAGPFVVHVTGTRFRVAWDPHAEKLAVSVTEGRVEVTGGGHPKHELVAGSELELRVGGAAGAASALERAEAAALAASAEPRTDTTPSPTVRDEDGGLLPRKGLEPKPDFRQLSTAGQYREALAAIEQLGFASQCESLGARDLLTLASTARLAGRADRAREAYLTARRRFPTSSEASISAFSLGRLASDANQVGDAISWFKRYLVEQPSGQLAREASGRLIELWRQTGNEAQARATAESYLKRYPSGPHAALARGVLAHP